MVVVVVVVVVYLSAAGLWHIVYSRPVVYLSPDVRLLLGMRHVYPVCGTKQVPLEACRQCASSGTDQVPLEACRHHASSGTEQVPLEARRQYA